MRTRRTIKMLGAVAVGVALSMAGHRSLQDTLPSAEAAASTKAAIRFDNASFYGQDGKFDVERGKDAVIALMKHHGYPIFPGVRGKLWVSDYGTGQFTKLGLAALMFTNAVRATSRL